MKTLLAFLRKEVLYQLRTGKLIIMGALFILLGVMNPAIAWLTPRMLELMSDALTQSGMNITVTTVSAMDSWVQFYKNMPIGLIVFIVVEGSIFTTEYRRGTLILSLTKGLQRYKVVLSKAVTLTTVWTLAYWLCFGITYAANACIWDNSVAQNLLLSAICWWLLGIWLISLVILISVVTSSGAVVLLGCGGAFLFFYIIGLFPKANKYVPTHLGEAAAALYGADGGGYTAAIIITVIITLACFAASIPLFNKKQL